MSQPGRRSPLRSSVGSRAQPAELAALLAILGLAAFLRLSHLDLVEFKSDEATMLNMALDWLDNGRWPLAGIASSTGLVNPPAMVYLDALPLLLKRDAAVATGFVGLLNVLAVALTYAFVRRYFGRAAALIAALLFATGLWPLLLTRKAWNVALLPLLSLLFMAAAYRVVVERRRSAVPWTLLWLGLMIQFHWSAVAYLPLALAVGLLSWRAWWHRRLLLGGLLFGATFLPWLAEEAERGFASFTVLLRAGETPPTWDLGALEFTSLLLTGDGYQALLGSDVAAEAAGLADLPLPAVLVSLTLLGLAVAASHAVSGFKVQVSSGGGGGRETTNLTPELKHPWCWRLLLLWVIVPILVYLRHPFPLYPHYFLQLFPALHVAAALGLVAGYQWLAGLRLGPSGFMPRAIGLAAGLFLVGHSAVQVARFLSVMDRVERGAPDGLFGLPLRFPLQAARWLSDHPEARDGPVLVVANEDLHPVLQFHAWGRFLTRRADQEGALVYPDGGATYLVASERSRAGAWLAHSPNFTRLARFPYPGDSGGLAVLRGPQPALDVVAVQQAVHPLAGGRFAAGIEVLARGAATEARAGEPLRLALLWRVADPPPVGPSFRFFNHLTAPNGATVAQADGIGFETPDWRSGDLVLSWFALPIAPSTPSGLYSLRSGLYDLGTLARSALVGAPSGDSLLLGTVRILAPAHLLPFASTPPVAAWSGGIHLARFQLPDQASPGESLPIQLLWRAESSPQRDYTVFVHLTDPSGAVVAQSDSYPSGGAAPTSAWRPGDLVADVIQVRLPSDLAPGTTLEVRLGLYTLDDQRRLPLAGGDVDHISLGKVEVTP
ncbi:MAG: glycosyltransferase family 39 protein [Chloroflexi bacterium]|nr:glycosyltransferase family 39 protein [Chloroflexota bacterium]